MATNEWWRRLDGVSLIEHERNVQREYWTDEIDDKHAHGELIQEAIAYASTYALKPKFKTIKAKKERILNLAKAGALIAAEIDRLGRIA